MYLVACDHPIERGVVSLTTERGFANPNSDFASGPASLLKGIASSALAPGAAPLWSGRAAAAEKIVYLTPFGYLMGFAETMYAQTGGFFAKHGLDVDIQGGRGSAMAVQQISAGNVLISRTGGTDMIKAAAKDPNIVAFAEIYQRDLFYVISSEQKPLTEPKQFAGKTIGIVSKGGATENILNMMLAKGGHCRRQRQSRNHGRGTGAVRVYRARSHRRLYRDLCDGAAVAGGQKALCCHGASTRSRLRPAKSISPRRKSLAERPEALTNFLLGVYDCARRADCGEGLKAHH